MTAVSQKKLAQDLGIGDRRVRQLVEELILPARNETGSYNPNSARNVIAFFRGAMMTIGIAFIIKSNVMQARETG